MATKYYQKNIEMFQRKSHKNYKNLSVEEKTNKR